MTDFKSSESMKKALKFYSLPNDTCSCRDENEDSTKIAKHFRKYYNELKKGKNGAEILTEFGILKTCCRLKYQLLAVEPMIDRSSERFVDMTKKRMQKLNTRILEPSIPPPDFPSFF
jgi:DNA-directed RNA polymerase subunit N (RpoN/RPB10)